ncbi:MAG: hypothetical protein ACPGYT_13730 [Nitrospirales bacterium]
MRRVLLLMGLSLFLMAGNCMHHPAVVYENPSEDYLNVTGTIEDGLEYKVTVTYLKSARAGDCPVFGKDPDICQVRPEEFSYVPQINRNTHKVHIPLKELSPGVGSWWEPHDLSICVRPKNTHSGPHECQVLFSITKDQHDGNKLIDLVCAISRWSSQSYSCHSPERVVEHVSQLNREYVVNISRESSLGNRSHDENSTKM